MIVPIQRANSCVMPSYQDFFKVVEDEKKRFEQMANMSLSEEIKKLRERFFSQTFPETTKNLSVWKPDHTGNNLKVEMDVSQFKPEELTVKTTDNMVVIEGKHEEKSGDSNFVSRHFVSQFTSPPGIPAEALKCEISSDNVLSISAPKPAQAIQDKPRVEKILPITHIKSCA